MSHEIIVAALGFFGTLLGSLLGVVATQKLTQFRLVQLEEKVNRHNQLIERTYILEGQMQEVRQDLKNMKSHCKGH